jgi:hypothetical protein
VKSALFAVLAGFRRPQLVQLSPMLTDIKARA